MKNEEIVKNLLDNGASRADLKRFGRKEFSKVIEKLESEKSNKDLDERVKHPSNIKGRFSLAFSLLYYAGVSDLSNYVSEETKYRERWENLQRALKGRKDAVDLYMDVEFLVGETLYMSFVLGYLFGESYQVRDNEHLQVIRDLIKEKGLFPIFPIPRNGKAA
jgi:hypothetical protein